MVRLLAFLTAALGCRIHEEEVSMQKKSQRTGRSWMEMAAGSWSYTWVEPGSTWGHREPGLPHPLRVSPTRDITRACPTRQHLPLHPQAAPRLLQPSPLAAAPTEHTAGHALGRPGVSSARGLGAAWTDHGVLLAWTQPVLSPKCCAGHRLHLPCPGPFPCAARPRAPQLPKERTPGSWWLCGDSKSALDKK